MSARADTFEGRRDDALRVTPFRLPLREPLATGAGTLRERRGELFRLLRPDGEVGHGEATPVPGFATPAAFRAAALECARLDAEARAAGLPLCHLLAGAFGRAPRPRVEVNALLAADDPDALAEEARRAAAAGHRTLKLKLAGRALRRGLERVARVRASLGERVRLRVDANGSLDPGEAPRVCRALADLGVELLEQPLAAPDLAGSARLRALRAVPIGADEGAATRRDALRVLAARAADVLVLKPSALGVAASFEIARLASDAGVHVIVTSALDGAVARAAALHVAAALPDPLAACGLATAALLAADLARPFPLRGGALELPGTPGLGVAPDLAALERLRTGPDRGSGGFR